MRSMMLGSLTRGVRTTLPAGSAPHPQPSSAAIIGRGIIGKQRLVIDQIVVNERRRLVVHHVSSTGGS